MTGQHVCCEKVLLETEVGAIIKSVHSHTISGGGLISTSDNTSVGGRWLCGSSEGESVTITRSLDHRLVEDIRSDLRYMSLLRNVRYNHKTSILLTLRQFL